MNELLKSIGDNIVELVVATAFLIGVISIGVVFQMGISDSNDRYTKCIEAGKQYVNGNCVN